MYNRKIKVGNNTIIKNKFTSIQSGSISPSQIIHDLTSDTRNIQENNLSFKYKLQKFVCAWCFILFYLFIYIHVVVVISCACLLVYLFVCFFFYYQNSHH